MRVTRGMPACTVSSREHAPRRRLPKKAAKKSFAVDLCNLLNKIVTIDTVYNDKGRK